jgi:hypothetical protein
MFSARSASNPIGIVLESSSMQLLDNAAASDLTLDPAADMSGKYSTCAASHYETEFGLSLRR